MELDKIIFLLKNYTYTTKLDGEIDEQDAAPATSTGGGEGYPTVTKWETGLTRGLANTIDDKVTWKSLYTTTRGKANTLL